MKCRQYDVKVFEMNVDSDSSFIDFMDNNYELLKNHLLSLKGELSPKVREYLDSKNLSYVNNMTLPIKRRSEKKVCVIVSPEFANSVESSSQVASTQVQPQVQTPQIQTQTQPSSEKTELQPTSNNLDIDSIKEETPTIKLQENLKIEPRNLEESKDKLQENQPNLMEYESDEELTQEEEEIVRRVKISEKDIIEKSPNIEDYGYGIAPLKVLTRPLRSGQFIQHEGAVLILERVNSGAKIAALGSIIALNRVEGDISSTGECLIIPRVRKGNIFFHGYRIELDRLIYPLNKLIFIGDRIVVQAISKKELI